jgi:hypothetical protein
MTKAFLDLLKELATTSTENEVNKAAVFAISQHRSLEPGASERIGARRRIAQSARKRSSGSASDKAPR